MKDDTPFFHTASNHFELPEVKPGQFLIAPTHNELIEPATLPVPNFTNPPSWFTSLDRRERGFRGCEGTQDYLRNGITFRLPAEVEVRPARDGKGWEARYGAAGPAGDVLRIESFPYESVGDTVPVANVRKMKEANFVKIINPWKVKTAPGWSSMLVAPFWDRTSLDWEITPGVINTDYYHSAHWVLMIYTDEPFTIPYGTPMSHMITFPRVKQERAIYGDSEIGHLLSNVGFGGPFIPFDRGRKYRIQEKISGHAKCPVSHSPDLHQEGAQKRSLWARMRRK